MSHLSDDDLQFFLGSQGLNNPGTAVSSLVEPAGTHGMLNQNMMMQYDPLFPQQSSLYTDNGSSNKRSNNHLMGSFPPMRSGKNSTYEQPLFEIKEMDKEADGLLKNNNNNNDGTTPKSANAKGGTAAATTA